MFARSLVLHRVTLGESDLGDRIVASYSISGKENMFSRGIRELAATAIHGNVGKLRSGGNNDFYRRCGATEATS